MPGLALIGDVMLGRGVGTEIGRRPPASFWGDALPVLLQTDGVIANLECCITTHEHVWREPKVFHFRAPPAATAVLREAGILGVCLANNHVLDYERQGLLDTIDHLDRAGIAHAGAGRDAAAAAEPAVFDAAGCRIGVVAFSDNEPGWVAGPESPGISFLDINADAATLARVESAALAARERGAEFVILSLHWGPNMVQRPPPRFRRFAHAAIDRGVDLVHGHSAHLFQGVEIHRGRLVLYDTGDFLDDYAVDPGLRNDQSFVFVVEVDEGRALRLQLFPVHLEFAAVGLARGIEKREIEDRMIRLSTELGTRVERRGATLTIDVTASSPAPR